MKKFTVILFGFITTILLAGCVTTQTTPSSQQVPERWNFHFDSRQWHIGYQAGDQQGALREYVLPGQTVDNWQELVTSRYSAVRVKPRAMFEYFKSQISRDCPSLQISVIEESSDSILFEWKHGGCQGYPAQHEIQRIVLTPTGSLVL